MSDDDGEDLKGYLIEYPRARCNVLDLCGDPAVSWERRERWASQIIKGMCRMHEQGFVVGGLILFTTPLILDKTDSVLFWQFRDRIIPGRTIGAYYPPEFCHMQEASPVMDTADRPFLTSKMDIFHLGLMLWLLAESNPITKAIPICIRQKFNAPGADACNHTHSEPDALPPLPESIPRYYRDMVDRCRAKKSGIRPTARDLLQLFPAQNGDLCEAQNGKLYEIGNVENRQGLRMSKVACSLCWKRPAQLELPIFHCNVCHMGDFDLCLACFEKGAHCKDEEHLLVELGKVGSWIVPRRYHSWVKSSGVRDVLDLGDFAC